MICVINLYFEECFLNNFVIDLLLFLLFIEKKIIKISYDDKLQLTAFWKQVTCGSYDPDKIPDVGYFDVIGNDRK